MSVLEALIYLSPSQALSHSVNDIEKRTKGSSAQSVDFQFEVDR